MAFFREQIQKGIIDVFRRKRSSEWRKVRKTFLKKHPFCLSCGRTKGLEVHHIEDFSTRPELELEESNLMSLCGKFCHFIFGHLMDWKSINPTVKEDSIRYYSQKQNRRS